MKIRNYDLSTFKTDHHFYNGISLLITIKSFDLQAIRERYLKTRSKKSNRTGSVERRKTSIGGIAHLEMKGGKIARSAILARMPEPRGVHAANDTLALSAENKVYVIDNEQIYTIADPWFSYIHTVQLNPDNQSRVLVSSSGFDSIFEYDFLQNHKTFEWFAWENGFARGRDPETGESVYLTRSRQQAIIYQNEGTPHIFISDPRTEKLPTAKRAAFINSVVYHQKQDLLLATFFHEGAVFAIDRKTGKAVKVLDGMKNPHGGQIYHQCYMGTSTGTGEVVTGDITTQNRYDFSKMPGKPEFLESMEWVQNTIPIGNNLLAIDSNRNAFVIFNPEKKLIDIIPYDPNWAVQDMAPAKISTIEENLIRKLG